MHALDEDYVTVEEAATLLRVAPSTIRRWIREGDLPAYRFGRRRVALKRADLATLITPARPTTTRVNTPVGDEVRATRRLTPEEKQRGLDAMKRARELRQQIFEQRGGKLFPPAWETLAELRDERTRQLS
jgi:excisionase family DNA binding protein